MYSRHCCLQPGSNRVRMAVCFFPNTPVWDSFLSINRFLHRFQNNFRPSLVRRVGAYAPLFFTVIYIFWPIKILRRSFFDKELTLSF